MSGRARFRELLEEAGLVHVDPRVLAFHLLSDGTYLGLTRQLFRALDAGDLAVQSSSLSLYQIVVEPYRRNREEDADRAADLLTGLRALELVPVTPEVARRAAQVRARLGGGLERAVQIATAVENGADLYLTQGSELRRVAGTRVVNLEDFAAGGG